jgi:zinc and cadmium transporter
MSIASLALLSVLLTSLVSLIGIFTLFLKEDSLKTKLLFLVSLSAGALFGDAFLHLIPEAIESGSEIGAPLMMLFGIIVFFVFEKVLHWHHHHAEDNDEDVKIHPVGPMVLVSDVIHNVIDGMVIAASFYVSPAVGVATTIAVMLHEIPHEIGNVSLLIHAGFSKIRAIVFNCISALGSLFGALVVVIFAEKADGIISFLVPFAAGTFVYIAGSDLVPELHKDIGIKKTLIQLLGILIGILAMVALLFLE